MEDTTKQSPLLAYRLPDGITKEQRDELNKQIKGIAKARKLNYFELFSLWVEADHLIGDDVKQTINTVSPDVTRIILDRLDNLEKNLTNLQLPLPFADDTKQTVGQDVIQNIKQTVNIKNPIRETLVERAKELSSQGKTSQEIADIFTQEKIPTPGGKAEWSARTIRDWVRKE